MSTIPTGAQEVIIYLFNLNVWVRKDAMATYLKMRDANTWKSKGTNLKHERIATIVDVGTLHPFIG